VPFGEFAHGFRLDVAGDDEDGVLRRVEAGVVAKRVRAVEALDLMGPADDRHAIGMMAEERGLHRFVELGARVGVAMHAPLLEHDVALGRDDLVGQRQAGHAVGFERHDGAQVLLGDTLKVSGVVVAGEGVLLAADLGDELRERALRMRLGSLEHEMLEEMGDARLARRIVGGTVAIPDHVRHHRRAPIGDHDDVEAVGKREVDNVSGSGRGGHIGA
jgi:hypothetical protein